MLVIDHIGQEMNQIGRVYAEYSSADQSRCFRTDPKIITGEVKPASRTTLGRGADKLVTILLGSGRGATGECVAPSLSRPANVSEIWPAFTSIILDGRLDSRSSYRINSRTNIWFKKNRS